jgi:hypothetical protein
VLSVEFYITSLLLAYSLVKELDTYHCRLDDICISSSKLTSSFKILFFDDVGSGGYLTRMCPAMTQNNIAETSGRFSFYGLLSSNLDLLEQHHHVLRK